jgi:hypothetical protein
MRNVLIAIGIIAVISLIMFGIVQVINSSKDTEGSEQEVATETDSNKEDQDQNPLLSDSQEKSLESIGINPGELPKEITPGMQVCFIEKLGAQRAQEIADGDSATSGDYIKAKSCLSM